jgi:hypothetical protein
MNQELIDLVTAALPGTILHTAERDGTVAVVEQRGAVRFYHAREFTVDGGEWTEAGGYSTPERHWYMGERYRSPALWGDYFSEVFA